MSSQNGHEFLTSIRGVRESVASNLIGEFGSAEAVFRAEESDLVDVSGVGPTTAQNILDHSNLDSENGISNEIQIQNRVLSGDIDKELLLKMVSLDLQKKVKRIEFSDTDPGGERIEYDLPNQAGVVKLFKLGKITCMGVNTVEKGEQLIAEFCDELRRLDIEFSDPAPEVVNVVGTASLNEQVPVQEAIAAFGVQPNSSDGDFPGYSFTLPETDCTFTLFSSGKVTILGGNSIAEVESAFELLQEQVAEQDMTGIKAASEEVHRLIDEFGQELSGANPDVIRLAHQIVSVFDAAEVSTDRGDPGLAAGALELAGVDATQSTIADVAGISPVTIRNTRDYLNEVTADTLE